MNWKGVFKGILVGVKIAAGVALKAHDAKVIRIRTNEAEGLQVLADVIDSRLKKSFSEVPKVNPTQVPPAVTPDYEQ